MNDPTVFSLSDRGVALRRNGKASMVFGRKGPPEAVDGWDIGLARLSRPPPHDGEMHPDGDELLYVMTGSISVILEETPQRTVDVRAGECIIVPQGVWHRLLIHVESELLYVTPGPHSKHRPRGARS